MGDSPEKQQLSLALDEPEEPFKTGELELDPHKPPSPRDDQTAAKTSLWTKLVTILRG